MSAAREIPAALARLHAARLTLVLDHAFYGSLILKMGFVEARGQTKTMATDGRSIFYSPAFVEAQPDAELLGTLAHEVMHPAMQHHTRRGGREPGMYNEAADYAINPILIDAGFVLPKGALLRDDFRGMSVEVIYERLKAARQAQQQAARQAAEAEQERVEDQADDSAGGTDDGESDDEGEPSSADDAEGDSEPGEGGESRDSNLIGDDGDGEPESADSGESGGEATQEGERAADGEGTGEGGSPGEPATEPAVDAGPGAGGGGGGESDDDWSGEIPGGVLDAPDPVTDAAEWSVNVEQAVKAARMRGQLPGGIAQAVEVAYKPRQDWRSILKRFMQQAAAADYSWRQPNRRYLLAGIYLPALRSEAMPPVAAILDTSGSTGPVQGEFLGEVQTAAEECQPERIDVIECDAAVQRVTSFGRGESIVLEGNQLLGQGGTDSRPAFEHIEREQLQPACAIFLTDGYTVYPEVPPDYPVLWVLTTPVEQLGGFVPPWGEIVELPGEIGR